MSSLLGLAALSVICGGLSAQAQMAEATGTTSSFSVQNSEVTLTQSDDPALTIAEMGAPQTSEATVTQSNDSAIAVEKNTVESAATPATLEPAPAISDAPAQQPVTESATQPAPVSNSAAALLDPANPQATPTAAATPENVAQFDTPDVDPGQATVSSSSYLGLGVNFDFDEGDPGLAILSKLGLTDRFSVRPNVVTDFDTATFRIPLTIDFPSQVQLGRFGIAPYLGGGLAFSVGDDSDVGPMLTAGVDVPLTSRFTGTAAFNVDFINDTDFGAYVGVGYNFAGLGGLFR